MEFYIVTGMSGAGKSVAVRVLEDLGFFCVDNLPPKIIPMIAEVGQMLDTADAKKMAVVIDSRSRDMWGDFNEWLEQIDRATLDFSIVFLDASTDVLFSRYRETRRPHPMQPGHKDTPNDLRNAIETERAFLGDLKERADIIIDTSLAGPGELRKNIMSVLGKHEEDKLMKISCLSFGYRNGLPLEADLVFDVRCLPNPFYIPELKTKSGNEPAVRDYIMQFDESQEMCAKITDYLKFAVPFFVKEGKSQLVIAVGCTGGKHRSVAVAEHLCSFLLDHGYTALTSHRDRDKWAVSKA